ncbi:hypothetical protein [Pseudomonas faucium]|uniref:hypothetical protein n=1 Tax=Pseudomonas faucium TaxID=2740518 RepID=UPI001596994F|nr:hypothetical protein [Pseudomonas faucium]
MQPHQYVLAMGVLWVATLAIAPFLFGMARTRAYNNGKLDGFTCRQEMYASQLDAARHQLNELRETLDSDVKQRADEDLKHARQLEALKNRSAELEARIMSYTGLPVTRSDYEEMLGVAEMLRLTQRTLNVLKSHHQAGRAGSQAEAIDELAKRIHAHLRSTPASAATVGAAA